MTGGESGTAWEGVWDDGDGSGMTGMGWIPAYAGMT